jgi:hypothetical protein
MRKLILLIMIITMAAIAAEAQILPNWTWAKAIGGLQGAQVQNLLMDNEGNMYISGTSFKGPLTMDGSLFSSDTMQSIFVAKLNSGGNLLWKISVLKNDPTYMGSLFPESIILDKQNNLYFTIGANGGMQGGSDTLNAIFNGNQKREFALIGRGYMEPPQKAIIKLDYDGNLKYIALMEGYGFVMPSKGPGFGLSINALAFDDQENLFMAGSFSLDSLILGNYIIRSINSIQNSFIAKVDTGGNYAWVTIDSASLPSSLGSEANSLILDASGNPLVFGDYYTADRKFGNLTITNSGSRNLYLVSLDKQDGSPKSLIPYGGNLEDISGSICADPKGNIYITGFTNSSSLFGMPTSGTQNYATFLANIDSTLKINWAKIISTEFSYASSTNTLKLVFGADNFPVLTGLFQSKTLIIDGWSAQNHDSASVPMSNDYFTARINPETHSATYLNSFGTKTYDNDFNVFEDFHNMLTIIAPLYDTIFYIGNDTLNYAPPFQGFIIAHFDATGALLGQASFLPESGQQFSTTSSNIVQSYSGYIGVAGGFFGKSLNLGSNILSAQDTTTFNIFIAKMGYIMTGNVFDQLAQKVTNGYVKLFVPANTGPAILVDSMNISLEGNSYYFSDAPLNGAIIYAVPDTSIYHNYVATYAGNSMLWTGAANLDLVTTPPSAFDVTLKQLLPITGPGSITGTVIETLQDTAALILKSAGRPMKGASVVLIGKSTKGTDTIIAITHTDEMGFYQFTKVPIGDYKIWIDVAGLGMKEYYAVTISDVAPAVENLNYIVAETGIFKDISEAIRTTRMVNEELIVYPNPVDEFIHVIIPMKGSMQARLDLYNISGVVINSIIIESPGSENALINTERLSSGIYFLKVSIYGKPALFARFMKQ